MLMQVNIYFYATWVSYSLNYSVPQEYINIVLDITQNSFYGGLYQIQKELPKL